MNMVKTSQEMDIDMTNKMGIKIMRKAQCVECDRIFDLLDEVDNEEWFYGHDCEA